MIAAPAILTDTTLCIGCEKCVAACKLVNGLGADRPRRWEQRIDDLSATRYTTIIRRRGARNVRAQCRHCREPACVSACLVGAMQKSPEGPVIYDSAKCMGCRYCMMACPFGIPRYDWEQAVPRVRKCTLCYQPISQGKLKEPACTDACPTKATIFGQRDVLLAEAHRRISQNPGKYQNTVLGETEIGGTSVLYISDISLDFLGFKPEQELGSEPLPQRTWEVLSKIPVEALGVGGAMAALWWIINRRNKLGQSAASGTAQNSGPRTARLPHEINVASHSQGEPGGPPPAVIAPHSEPTDQNQVKK